MSLANGTRLGPYEILSPIGSGGMGDVYRARDTRLDLTVAVKTVRGEFNERFEREARTISSLNHPSICTLHDVGVQDGVSYLVMELVEGETLAARLEKGPAPLAQAVRIAIEIAGALAAAHAKGIAHRDLKPANIMLTRSGVKLLDFGLAKAVAATGGLPVDQTQSMALPISGVHAVVGTPQYMAPEQVEGQDVDSRADIFAFGCVLYEMLSGRPAFEGKSATLVMAAVLEREPEALPAMPALDWLLRRCLEKDRERRFRSIHDVRLELERVEQAPAPSTAAAMRRRSDRVAWAVAALAAVVAFVVWFSRPAKPADVPLARLTSDAGVTTWPAISNDGQLAVYASDRDGGTNLDLYVQHIPGGSPVRLTHTDENESEPAFSPDGGAIAFRSEKNGGAIYLMPSLGGEPRLLVQGGHDPRFSPDGKWIAYWTGKRLTGDVWTEGLTSAFVIPSSGGSPRRLRPEFSVVRSPVWSPDGRMLLFLGLHPGTEPPVERWDAWATPALEDGKPIASGLLKRVTGLGGNAALPDDLNWTADGLVFTARAGWARNLYRCPVDAAGRTTANLVGLTNGTEIAGRVMVSRSGRAVFSSGAEKFDVWTLPVDANAGKVTGTPSRVTNGFDLAQHPTISGDGKKVLYDSSRNGISQIWLKDLVTGKESLAVTGQRGVGAGLFLPVSGRIAYRQTSGNVDLLDPGTGETRRIAEGSTLWSIDHRESLAFISGPPSTLPGIDVVDLKSLKRTRILQPQAGHPLYQAHPSPDGRWVVFLESGSASSIIYAVRFRGTEEIPRSEWIPLTEDKQGLDKPRFSPDGKLVYFTANREGSRAIDALRFDAETGHAIGAPFAVYDADTPRLSLAGVNLGALSIDVARDKIVMILAEETSNIWLADLHRYN